MFRARGVEEGWRVRWSEILAGGGFSGPGVGGDAPTLDTTLADGAIRATRRTTVMTDTLTTAGADTGRERPWVMDREGRVLEGTRKGDVVARGWVDTPGGVGRIVEVDSRESSVSEDLLGVLASHYPGVRWFADRELV